MANRKISTVYKFEMQLYLESIFPVAQHLKVLYIREMHWMK